MKEIQSQLLIRVQQCLELQESPKWGPKATKKHGYRVDKLECPIFFFFLLDDRNTRTHDTNLYKLGLKPMPFRGEDQVEGAAPLGQIPSEHLNAQLGYLVSINNQVDSLHKFQFFSNFEYQYNS